MSGSAVTDEELAAIEQAVAAGPFGVANLRRLGKIYLERNRPIDAIAVFMRVIADDPSPEDQVNLLYARSQAAIQILERKAEAAGASGA